MRCEFHPDALTEYEEAARYYAGCHAGLDTEMARGSMGVSAVTALR
jgi:hypothetical protein